MKTLTVQKQQEARSFIGRNGLNYAKHFANEQEKNHFEGIIYKNGTPDSDSISNLISYLASPAYLH